MTFYGKHSSITMLTRAHHWIVKLMRPVYTFPALFCIFCCYPLVWNRPLQVSLQSRLSNPITKHLSCHCNLYASPNII